MSSDKETTGIRAVMILDIIGKPAEHLVSTLKDFVKKIGEEKISTTCGSKSPSLQQGSGPPSPVHLSGPEPC